MRRLLNPWYVLALVPVVAAMYVCWRLSGWQWGRAEGDSGSARNYIYSGQWIFFGLMFPYGWARIGYDRVRPPSEAKVRKRIRHDEITYVDKPVIDDSNDPELAAYNAMLARLNKKADR